MYGTSNKMKIEVMDMITKKKITISVDLHVYEQIKEWAKEEDRSFSQQAARIFKEALERRENEPEK